MLTSCPNYFLNALFKLFAGQCCSHKSPILKYKEVTKITFNLDAKWKNKISHDSKVDHIENNLAYSSNFVCRNGNVRL